MIDHKARARQAWPFLIQRVRSGGTYPHTTYGQVSASIGLHHRSASWFLGVIQRYCAATGLPPLQSLVVNKKTKVPGRGYVGYGHGSKNLKKALKEILLHKWPLKAPF